MEPVYFGQSVGKFILYRVWRSRHLMLKSFAFEVFLPNSSFSLTFFFFFPVCLSDIYLHLLNIVTDKSQWTSHDIIIVVHFKAVVGFVFIISMDFFHHSLGVLDIPMKISNLRKF